MSDEKPRFGPSLETLRNLAGMLPSYAHGLIEKKIAKNHNPVVKEVPNKICEICAVLFFDPADKVESSILEVAKPDPEIPPPLKSGVCPKCASVLAEGYTAFTTQTHYCFGKSSKLADMAGKVVLIRQETMDKMRERFDVQEKQKRENGKN